MEPCVFRMPFPSYYKDADEASLLANVFSFFAPAQANPQQSLASSVLQQFDFVANDNPQQIRNFVMNNLLRLSATAKAESVQIKALELLGKTKDVSMFEERSSVLIEHMTTDELKAKLSEKVQRLREKTIDAVTVETHPTTQQEQQ